MGDVSKTPVGNWQLWHYLALAALTGFAGWLAFFQLFPSPYDTWLLLMAVLIAFLAVAGHGIKGHWRGALIDEYNRLSLSRLQMLAWTVLVVAALGTIGVRQARDNPATGLEIEVPPEIWMLMGLSTVSLLASPAIKQKLSRDPAPPNAKKRLQDQGSVAGRMEAVGQVAANQDVGSSRWSNLFMGETVNDAGYLDIPKVQMFFFSVLTLLIYGTAIGKSLILAAPPDGELPAQLPELSDSILTLLAISHGGYLVGKMTGGQGAPPAGQEPPAPPAPPQTPEPEANQPQGSE